MALPKGHEARSREDWLALLENNNDAADRKKVTSCLRALGHEPNDYMQWTFAERVDVIMKAQGDQEVGDDSGAGGGGDEEEDKPKTSGKGKGKAKASSGKSSSSSGSSKVDLSEINDRLDTQQAMIEELSGDVETLIALLSDAHYLVRVLVQSNKQLKANSEDEDLQEVLYQKLVVSGNEED